MQGDKNPESGHGKVLMKGVREYNEREGDPILEVVAPTEWNRLDSARLCVVAMNEGGHNKTVVDVVDLIQWIRSNRPGLLLESRPQSVSELREISSADLMGAPMQGHPVKGNDVMIAHGPDGSFRIENYFGEWVKVRM